MPDMGSTVIAAGIMMSKQKQRNSESSVFQGVKALAFCAHRKALFVEGVDIMSMKATKLYITHIVRSS